MPSMIPEMLRRLRPDRRAKLIRFLELASDDPRLSDETRQRVDRHLINIKKILRATG